MNFGFYHALYCLEHKPKYIVNFDNDIICLDNWLSPLIKVMEEDTKVGIVGGKQWTKDMTVYRSVGIDLVGGSLAKNYPCENKDVMWIQGSFVMMRTEMMLRIGIHDDRFKIVCSDSDYCLHAKDRGWKVVFVADSNVIHIGGASYTTECETWEVDNKNLLQKWSGIKSMHMLKGFPLEFKGNKYLRTKYEICESA
jgi:GT2 family glycosyltransferase